MGTDQKYVEASLVISNTVFNHKYSCLSLIIYLRHLEKFRHSIFLLLPSSRKLNQFIAAVVIPTEKCQFH